jgi:dimethylargininase
MIHLMALTRAAGPALAGCELTYLAREPIDLAEASRQHHAYCAALSEAGIRVTTLPAAADLPDAVFVEDAAVVLDEAALLARPGKRLRRLEVAAIAEALAEYRTTVHRIEAPGTLEGGDVLRLGRRIYVGQSSRSNASGLHQLAAFVRPLGYDPVRVPVHGCLHLKTAVTALDEDTVLLNPRWVDSGAFGECRHIEVPEDEPFAANTLTLGGVVHLSSRWVRTRRLLDGHGFETKAVRVSEFEKAEAGLTCLSLIFATREGRD